MTLPESRTRLILGNKNDLKTRMRICAVNNWTLIMHVMTCDDNCNKKHTAIWICLVWIVVNTDHMTI